MISNESHPQTRTCDWCSNVLQVKDSNNKQVIFVIFHVNISWTLMIDSRSRQTSLLSFRTVWTYSFEYHGSSLRTVLVVGWHAVDFTGVDRLVGESSVEVALFFLGDDGVAGVMSKLTLPAHIHNHFLSLRTEVSGQADLVGQLAQRHPLRLKRIQDEQGRCNRRRNCTEPRAW